MLITNYYTAPNTTPLLLSEGTNALRTYQWTGDYPIDPGTNPQWVDAYNKNPFYRPLSFALAEDEEFRARADQESNAFLNNSEAEGVWSAFRLELPADTEDKLRAEGWQIADDGVPSVKDRVLVEERAHYLFRSPTRGVSEIDGGPIFSLIDGAMILHVLRTGFADGVGHVEESGGSRATLGDHKMYGELWQLLAGADSLAGASDDVAFTSQLATALTRKEAPWAVLEHLYKHPDLVDPFIRSLFHHRPSLGWAQQLKCSLPPVVEAAETDSASLSELDQALAAWGIIKNQDRPASLTDWNSHWIKLPDRIEDALYNFAGSPNGQAGFLILIRNLESILETRCPESTNNSTVQWLQDADLFSFNGDERLKISMTSKGY